VKLLDHLAWNDVNSDNLNFYKAIGVECLLVHIPAEMADGRDPTDDFKRLRRFVEGHGLELAVLHSHNVPRDRIIHGLPGREEQIEGWRRVLRGIGRAGVPATATTFYAISHFRSPSTVGRGGARFSTFDYEAFKRNAPHHPDRAISAERLWENLEYFLKRVVPVAEEAGVRIALHPDDPPVPDPLGGAARIMVSLANFERAFGLALSRANGMLFCQGCVAEMGEDVVKAIHRIGGQDKIVFVHFRNIRGTPYNFQEVFIDEGDMDMVRAMQAYKEVGYDGPIMLDHTPGIPNDPQARAGHAFANGYIKALIQAVYR
jgi:mannonate dehydratase